MCLGVGKVEGFVVLVSYITLFISALASFSLFITVSLGKLL